MRSSLLLLLLPLLGLGCRPEVRTSTPATEEHEPLENAVDTIRPHALGAPIDIATLKQQPWLQTTSGVLGQQSIHDMCPDGPSGFFGFYFLHDRDIQRKAGTRNPDGRVTQACDGHEVGRLTIYKSVPSAEWSFDDKDEQFLQIELHTDRVKVWDALAVGDPVDSLLAFIGERFHYKKGTFIIADLGDYHGEFQVHNDTIRSLTVKRACDTLEGPTASSTTPIVTAMNL